MPQPPSGRIFRVGYRVRLSDADATGRLRLDAVARYLQDAAIDDVSETGWGAPEHLWVLRSVRVDVLAPFLADEVVDIVTWGSSFSSLAAGRRWSLSGDAGGAIEVDSTWIHLGPDARPARIGEGFEDYAEAAQGRVASTKLTLSAPRRRHAGRVAASLDRRGSHGSRQQRRVLGRGRGAASAARARPPPARTGLGSSTDIRSTSATTSSSSRTPVTTATSLHSSSATSSRRSSRSSRLAS